MKRRYISFIALVIFIVILAVAFIINKKLHSYKYESHNIAVDSSELFSYKYGDYMDDVYLKQTNGGIEADIKLILNVNALIILQKVLHINDDTKIIKIDFKDSYSFVVKSWGITLKEILEETIPSETICDTERRLQSIFRGSCLKSIRIFKYKGIISIPEESIRNISSTDITYHKLLEANDDNNWEELCGEYKTYCEENSY